VSRISGLAFPLIIGGFAIFVILAQAYFDRKIQKEMIESAKQTRAKVEKLRAEFNALECDPKLKSVLAKILELAGI